MGEIREGETLKKINLTVRSARENVKKFERFLARVLTTLKTNKDDYTGKVVK